MSARVIGFHGSVPMMGLDHHGGLYYVNLWNGLSPGYPLPPAPIPPGFGFALESLHYVNMTSDGGIGAAMLKVDKSNPTVLANDRGSILSKDHECRSWHLPPGGNILVAVTIYFSSTKASLSVSQVQASNGPVACTMDGFGGVNVNCNDPFSTFYTNIVLAFGTVEVMPTPKDVVDFLAEWAENAVVEAAASYGYGKFGDWVKGGVNRLPLPKWAWFKALPGKARDAIPNVGVDAFGDVAKWAIGKGKDAVKEWAAEDNPDADRQ